jgi:ABC-type nitrate/sulfonate/bicarbonate transport system substrate-binding protein
MAVKQVDSVALPFADQAISRRRFLRTGSRVLAGSTVALGAAGLLDACSSSSKSSSSSSSAAAASSSGAASSAAAPAAGATSTTVASLGTVRFQFDWITNVQFGGSYIAEAQGYYTDAGVNVSLVTGGPNVTVIPIVQAGSADVGIVDPPTTAAANKQGADMVIIGTTYQKSPNCIISLASDPITTPAQLQGKKVGIGVTSVAVMQAFMKANNLAYSSMTVVPIQFDPAPLAAGEVQGYFGFISNEAVTLQLEGHPVHTMLLADFGLSSFAECYGVRRASLQDTTERAKIKAFLEGEIRGWQDVVANPQPAVNLTIAKYGKALSLDPKQQLLEAQAQNGLVADADTQAHGLLWMSDAAIDANLKTLALAGTPTTAALFDNSLLEEIYQGQNHL